MSKLENVSEEELLKELEKRKKKKLEPPKLHKYPDTKELHKTMKRYREYLMSDDYRPDNDWYFRISEVAIEAFFTGEFWDWFNGPFREAKEF